MELYCNLILGFGKFCTGYAGDYEVAIQIVMESLLGYRARFVGILTMKVILL